jgi:hypothetical protein
MPPPARYGYGALSFASILGYPMRIVWHPVVPSPPTALAVEGGVETAAPSALVDALLEAGIPAVDEAGSPVEDAVGLLTLAAEVEHALMVQYLYASFSIVGAAPTVPEDPREKVVQVAVQEMGHLISVQNLLLGIAGPAGFHLGRDRLRTGSPDNPLPLTLEPLSRMALAKFVVAEMPADIPNPALKARVDAIRALVAQPGGGSPHRVGALYAALFWLFQPDDTPIPPMHLSVALGFRQGWHLRPEDFIDPAVIAAHEAKRSEWRANVVPGFVSMRRALLNAPPTSTNRPPSTIQLSGRVSDSPMDGGPSSPLSAGKVNGRPREAGMAGSPLVISQRRAGVRPRREPGGRAAAAAAGHGRFQVRRRGPARGQSMSPRRRALATASTLFLASSFL